MPLGYYHCASLHNNSGCGESNFYCHCWKSPFLSHLSCFTVAKHILFDLNYCLRQNRWIPFLVLNHSRSRYSDGGQTWSFHKTRLLCANFTFCTCHFSSWFIIAASCCVATWPPKWYLPSQIRAQLEVLLVFAKWGYLREKWKGTEKNDYIIYLKVPIYFYFCDCYLKLCSE